MDMTEEQLKAPYLPDSIHLILDGGLDSCDPEMGEDWVPVITNEDVVEERVLWSGTEDEAPSIKFLRADMAVPVKAIQVVAKWYQDKIASSDSVTIASLAAAILKECGIDITKFA